MPWLIFALAYTWVYGIHEDWLHIDITTCMLAGKLVAQGVGELDQTDRQPKKTKLHMCVYGSRIQIYHVGYSRYH